MIFEEVNEMKNRKIVLVASFLTAMVLMTSCQGIRMKLKNFQEDFFGLSMTIQSYDEDSQIIDSLHGKSVSIERDKTFDSNEESSDSPVLRITVGKNVMNHVGSSLILYEDGLNDVFEEFTQRINVGDMDRSIPIMNRMFADMENKFTGRDKVILIRSQNGTPLATFVGDKVSVYKTDVPKSTGILIDGKKLYIYRCDYTIYDRELFE